MLRSFTAIAILGVGIAALSACVPQERGWAVAYKPGQSPKIAVIMPADAPSITQEFLSSGNGAGHEGIDIAAPVGTPVIAAAGGIVRESFFEPLYGNRVVIDHGPDAGGVNWVSVYKHLNARLAVPGAVVARGQKIATLGATGALAGGLAHLHFELRRGATSNAVAVDPHRYWTGGVGVVSCYRPDAQAEPGTFRITYPVSCGGPAPAPVQPPENPLLAARY